LGDGSSYERDFIIQRKTANLGYCGIRKIPDGRTEIFYGYAETAWGKGYATEAARAVIAYGKEHFAGFEGDPMVIAMTYPQNPASAKVVQKLGFVPIGQEEHFGHMLDILRWTYVHTWRK